MGRCYSPWHVWSNFLASAVLTCEMDFRICTGRIRIRAKLRTSIRVNYSPTRAVPPSRYLKHSRDDVHPGVRGSGSCRAINQQPDAQPGVKRVPQTKQERAKQFTNHLWGLIWRLHEQRQISWGQRCLSLML
jgi:hypothetical protein